MVLSIISWVLTLVAGWIIFKKMGREGWEGIIPVYDVYVLCKILYGNGWKMLLFLIPFYNIYFMFKMNIDWAKAFNKSTGFGIGLTFLSFIFRLILAFGDAKYGDGTAANNSQDFVSQVVGKTKEVAAKAVSTEDGADELKKYKDLYDQGVLTEEEFEAKKKQILGL